MNERGSALSKIFSIIFTIIVIVLLYNLYGVYKLYNFNGFEKAEYYVGKSAFIRDEQIRYSDEKSYKIKSEEFNDVIFYKKIEVKPNTPYKLKCMVKTENVEVENNMLGSGAQICMVGNTDRSKVLTGTNDWQELEFMFNSKKNTSIEIGFRLGGNESNCKGTVWFSDFILQEGTQSSDTQWNFACFIFENIDVKLDEYNNNLKVSMQRSDIDKVKSNMDRFKTSCKELSNDNMTVKYDIFNIKQPIKSITYSEEFGYYVDPKDVEEILYEYLKDSEYDHVFAVVKLGDTNKNIEIPVNDWIGLGGMKIQDIGFSNIRLPSNKDSYVYTYDTAINTFPEEVFIHEFLHSLERIIQEYGYDRPELHDYLKYGYQEQKLIGLKNWYKDYMCNTIFDKESNTYIGLDSIVYSLKPAKQSNFNYVVNINFNEEPENFIEEIMGMFKFVINSFGNGVTNISQQFNNY